MTRPQELAKQPDAVKMFDEIARAAGEGDQGNHVFWALFSAWDFEHAFDDILDSGKICAVEKECLLKNCHHFIHATLTPHVDLGQVAMFRAQFIVAAQSAGMEGDHAALALKALDGFTENLLRNPFYRTHLESHRTIFDMMILRCIAGDEMEASPEAKRKQLAPAVRCADIDFMVNVALLAGGWPLARKLTCLRDYDV